MHYTPNDVYVRSENFRRQWHIIAPELMTRDGVNRRTIPDDKLINIKDNPLLQAAILDLRDEYFELIAQRLCIEDSGATHREMADMLEENAQSTSMLLAKSSARLSLKDYGYLDAQKNEILQHCDKADEEFPQLDNGTALRLTGSIIRKIVDSARAAEPGRNIGISARTNSLPTWKEKLDAQNAPAPVLLLQESSPQGSRGLS